ncbi:hypothetical protein MRX96_019253 [Rhipicephalus microplus]
MLTKPFVFVVQVVATIFGTEAAEYKSVLTDPSHGWKELHGIEIPLRGHRCLIEEAALSLVPTPTHAPTSVTSATSDLPTAIRSHVPPSNFSGPGSGTQGEMLTKPFVFVVQVVATIFGTEAAEYKSVLTDPSHGWKERHGIEIPLRVAPRPAAGLQADARRDSVIPGMRARRPLLPCETDDARSGGGDMRRRRGHGSLLVALDATRSRRSRL